MKTLFTMALNGNLHLQLNKVYIPLQMILIVQLITDLFMMVLVHRGIKLTAVD